MGQSRFWFLAVQQIESEVFSESCRPSSCSFLCCILSPAGKTAPTLSAMSWVHFYALLVMYSQEWATETFQTGKDTALT